METSNSIPEVITLPARFEDNLDTLRLNSSIKLFNQSYQVLPDRRLSGLILYHSLPAPKHEPMQQGYDHLSISCGMSLPRKYYNWIDDSKWINSSRWYVGKVIAGGNKIEQIEKPTIRAIAPISSELGYVLRSARINEIDFKKYPYDSRESIIMGAIINIDLAAWLAKKHIETKYSLPEMIGRSIEWSIQEEHNQQELVTELMMHQVAFEARQEQLKKLGLDSS